MKKSIIGSIVIVIALAFAACGDGAGGGDVDPDPDKVVKPIATPGGGTYTAAQSVTLATTTTGAAIYYTTNGAAPTASSTPYAGAITISATTTLKAIAVKDGMTASDVLTATYTINIPPNLVIDGVGWADCNLDEYQTFAAKPDMYTCFYQWNRITAHPATGDITEPWDGSNAEPAWTVNPCPAGWRLPTMAEFEALIDSGHTWAAAGARGNEVAGRFFGPNHATASLPGNMAGAIFIPGCGARDAGDTDIFDQGLFGEYWGNATEYGGCFVFNSGATCTT
ncbi:MAG: chitobiase/beta-hexosaminidase C-terminal domain-containing protein, partial [Clostridia bacterium]|nr:chitobiase/beta-hexosaminidase C-terminal domain-containing protein [Clostridia bacterium]